MGQGDLVHKVHDGDNWGSYVADRVASLSLTIGNESLGLGVGSRALGSILCELLVSFDHFA